MHPPFPSLLLSSMGLLDKLGLGNSKARPVGKTLEKGQPEENEWEWADYATKAAIFVALVVVALLAYPGGERLEVTVQEGDIWRQDVKTAPFSFAIYKHPDTLAAERRRVEQNTPAFIQEIPDALRQTLIRGDTLQVQLDEAFAAFNQMLAHRAAGEEEATATDSLLYRERRRSARVRLSSTQWATLERDHRLRNQALEGADAPPRGQPLHQELVEEATRISQELQREGVLDVPHDSIHSEEVIVRNVEERTQRPPQPIGNFLGLDKAYEEAEASFAEVFPERPEVVSVAMPFFRAVFVPTHAYMQSETRREIRARESRLSPTRGRVDQGDVIVREGERVTPQVRQQLVSLERAQRERLAGSIAWKQESGNALLIIAAFGIFFLYIYLVRPTLFFDNTQVFLMALQFAGIIGLFAVGVRYPVIGMYAVPVAIVSVLFTVIFDSRVGFFGTITLGLLGGLLLGYDFEYAFATIFAGAIAVFSVRDIKNRGQFFLSAGLVFLAYMLIIFSTWLLYDTPVDTLWRDSVRVAGSSFLLVLAYPLLWVFERTFNITTDLTLLELSDTNRPLLKELSVRAPGSFNHVMQVANLSEAGATAIGANALLTRVGALYHDIGKMLKPEYFIENQRGGTNPHNDLKPRMSALIIASHVREGLEMGRQYNLPQPVLDFITTHHGTSRIEYFYRKACEQAENPDTEVPESEFRYPGPRPFSKETGVLMLADSLEAACRSLSEPTHKRLETMLEMIFETRIDDGQLDDTDLTFRDLQQLKETFLSMLLGIHHVRVKYPGQKGGGAAAEADEAAAEETGAEALPGKSAVEVSVDPSLPIADPSKLKAGELAGGTLYPRSGTSRALLPPEVVQWVDPRATPQHEKAEAAEEKPAQESDANGQPEAPLEQRADGTSTPGQAKEPGA